jgi:hypothetical protein
MCLHGYNTKKEYNIYNIWLNNASVLKTISNMWTDEIV